METQKLSIGELRLRENHNNYYFSLIDILVIYEALKEYQSIITKDANRSKIKDCAVILEQNLNMLNRIHIGRYIRFDAIKIEDVLTWAESNFESETHFNINNDNELSDLPF